MHQVKACGVSVSGHIVEIDDRRRACQTTVAVVSAWAARAHAAKRTTTGVGYGPNGQLPSPQTQIWVNEGDASAKASTGCSGRAQRQHPGARLSRQDAIVGHQGLAQSVPFWGVS